MFLTGSQFCQIGDWLIVSEAADRLVADQWILVSTVARFSLGKTIPSSTVAPSEVSMF